ncbi:MAG: ROK family protein [Patescibacteria group bacterium]
MKRSSIIGVDLGGTKIAAARYDPKTWEIEAKERIETHADQSFSRVLEDMVRLILSLKTEDTTAFGVGVPGLVEQPDGIVLRFPNIPGSDRIPLKELLHDAIGLPVFLENDGNCFALAEAIHGAGKDEKIVLGITMGTGVGGGIVLGKKLYHGHHGFAAEIGHMLLVPGKPPYETDDRRGDVEQFLSGSALGKRCGQAKNPSEYLRGETCAFLLSDIIREVGWLCTSLIHLLDPSVIVFGGSAGRALAPHLDGIEKKLKHWLLPGTPLPKLTIGLLKDAGTRGAALLAQEPLHESESA